MIKPNTKTAAALSIAVLIIVAYGTASGVEGKNLLVSESPAIPSPSFTILQLSALVTETAQYTVTPVQAAYGIAAALIALGVIVFMVIREKANTITPETIW